MSKTSIAAYLLSMCAYYIRTCLVIQLRQVHAPIHEVMGDADQDYISMFSCI